MKRLLAFFLALLVFLLVAGYWLYQRPLPVVQAEVVIPQSSVNRDVALPWPAYGQAAFGAVDYGVLEKKNTSKPVPIASISKVIAALAILKQKPLESSQQGPSITITEADVQLYRDYLAKDGSVVPVNIGQQISQYQALQAMLLPSANNMADTTTRWAFGSTSDYTNYANQLVKMLGMNQTTVADASGFSPKTISTADDLIKLGEAVLKNPVLAEIISQSTANFPGVGVINNVNWLLGTDGILGIKTGNTDEAGGCYLFGAKRTIGGRQVTVVGAILGAPTRNIAMSDSRVLIEAADKGFEVITAVKQGQVVGRYTLPWGGSVEAVSSDELKILNWNGNPLVVDGNLSDLAAPKEQGYQIGSVKSTTGDIKSVNVALKQPVSSPPWTWRIFH